MTRYRFPDKLAPSTWAPPLFHRRWPGTWHGGPLHVRRGPRVLCTGANAGGPVQL